MIVKNEPCAIVRVPNDAAYIAMTNFADRTIWSGDHLDILSGLNSASMVLIHLDPPFDSNRNYAAPESGTAAGAALKEPRTLFNLDVAWMGLTADEQPANRERR